MQSAAKNLEQRISGCFSDHLVKTDIDARKAVMVRGCVPHRSNQFPQGFDLPGSPISRRQFRRMNLYC
jgi:hypothetical protein